MSYLRETSFSEFATSTDFVVLTNKSTSLLKIITKDGKVTYSDRFDSYQMYKTGIMLDDGGAKKFVTRDGKVIYLPTSAQQVGSKRVSY